MLSRSQSFRSWFPVSCEEVFTTQAWHGEAENQKNRNISRKACPERAEGAAKAAKVGDMGENH